MDPNGQQRCHRQPIRAHQPNRGRPQHHRQRIKHRHAGPHIAAHGTRGGSHADHRIIITVLQRIDRIVTHHPGNRTKIQQNPRQRQRARHINPADQRRPGKHHAQPRLRPPRNALHKGVGGHQSEAEDSDKRRHGRQLEQDDQADKAQRDQPDPCGPQRNHTARQRTLAGAFHLCIQIAVDNIVIDAPCAAHRNRPHQQPEQQVPTLNRATRQRDAPCARPEQQPPPNRSIKPGQ